MGLSELLNMLVVMVIAALVILAGGMNIFVLD
jgi:hypothetical protein